MVTSRLPRFERRQQLLTVARQVLASKGYHEATMADIADAAGVTKPVLYQHFTSKHALYQTLLVEIGDELRTRVVGAATASDGPKERVAAGITAFVEYVTSERDGFSIFYSGINRHDDDWATIMAEVEESLSEAVMALIDVPSVAPERRQVMARGIIGMAETSVRYALFDHDLDIDTSTLTGDIINMVWGGVRYIGVEEPRK